METYLAVGSNLGAPEQNIAKALDLLRTTRGIRVKAVSPVYKTPAALLYATARDDDNRPYLNCSVQTETTLSAPDLLKELKRIEKQMGRDASRRWTPRPVDLDIIFYGNEKIQTPELTVPHPRYAERSFVLDPLSWFKTFPADMIYTQTHQPLIAGVLNVTPDSFSDGGKHNTPDSFAKTFSLWEKSGVQIVDIGAQSTRPNAPDVDVAEELKRLSFVFDFLKNREKSFLSPKLSLDTKHAATAQKALEAGFDVINDVDGLDDPDMAALARDFNDRRFIVMRHDPLTAPFDKLTAVVREWFLKKADMLDAAGIDLSHVYFDVGIGFGCTATQSLYLLQHLSDFHINGVKLAVGHSRKSFMRVFTAANAPDRNEETLAMSVAMADKVDLLRVHTPVEHLRAIVAAGHLCNQFF